jgi:aryl-alcohol dehydrogenase-like predicted oxidoreductase
MNNRSLGSAGPQVGALGLGCMGMSPPYGLSGRTESIATIHAALDAGVTLIDTGDFYGMGHNEMLIGEALRTAPTELRDKASTTSTSTGSPASTRPCQSRTPSAPSPNWSRRGTCVTSG